MRYLGRRSVGNWLTPLSMASIASIYSLYSLSQSVSTFGSFWEACSLFAMISLPKCLQRELSDVHT